jgi:hypothetical protein
LSLEIGFFILLYFSDVIGLIDGGKKDIERMFRAVLRGTKLPQTPKKKEYTLTAICRLKGPALSYLIKKAVREAYTTYEEDNPRTVPEV